MLSRAPAPMHAEPSAEMKGKRVGIFRYLLTKFSNMGPAVLPLVRTATAIET